MAATSRPGLIGALLVGLSTAKALAAAARLPFAAVDHLHGHVAANYLEPDPLEPPFLCLIASGGHTLLACVERHDGYELLGSTRDDAAGEALDKARAPDGPRLSRAAPRSTAWRARATRGAFDFPLGMRRGDSLDFSFSGLKTALVYKVRELGAEQTLARRADLAASYERAVVESLMVKLGQALERDRAPPAGDRGRRGGELPAAPRVEEQCDRSRHRAEDPAGRTLHRQRGDDRVGGEVRAAGPVS